MGCFGGSCSCGKGNQSPVEENVHLVQMSTSQGMLPTFDWMKDLGSLSVDEEVVEVRFKNNRKEFFRNSFGITLAKVDRIVVEVDGGHDLGTVSLSGSMADKQFQKKKGENGKTELKKVYRKATQVDTDSWLQSKRRERDVLLEARSIANNFGLDMSISDVEFQGDGKKVTIYYTADNRVDFRELIKKYAGSFRVRIEMKQIGARQEAAMTGGLGSCGRELCCSTWKTDMNSVKTEAARTQNLSLTTSKLTGQCGKLKCCLNYELDTYLEAWESFPAELIQLDSDRGILMPLHPDVLKGTVHYGLSRKGEQTRYEIPVEQVKLYISLNKKGKKVETGRIVSTNASIKEDQALFN
jgi:cell fate regulator YaaT (PSP1 superfamily)